MNNIWNSRTLTWEGLDLDVPSTRDDKKKCQSMPHLNPLACLIGGRIYLDSEDRTYSQNILSVSRIVPPAKGVVLGNRRVDTCQSQHLDISHAMITNNNAFRLITCVRLMKQTINCIPRLDTINLA